MKNKYIFSNPLLRRVAMFYNFANLLMANVIGDIWMLLSVSVFTLFSYAIKDFSNQIGWYMLYVLI